MAGLTDYAEQKALERLLRGTAFTPPTTIYTGPLLALPNDAGSGGSEVTAAGSGRLAVAFGAYANRQILNTNALSWTAGAAWGTIIGHGFWDASTAGNLLAVGTLAPFVTIANGDPYDIAVGEITIDCTKFGPYLAQQVLELLFKATAKSQISTYAHLCTTAPTDDGAGAVVVTGTGYAAQAVPAYAAYASGKCTFAADLSFTTSTGASWGTLPAFMLRDSSSATGGNFLGQGAISPAPTVGAGVPFALAAASTYIGLD
jgi:hypothetical protein